MYSQYANHLFSSVPLEKLYIDLDTSAEGLSAREAVERLREQSKTVKTKSRFARECELLFRQFSNPLILLLAVAVVLSAILGESSDAFIILTILVISGLFGFWQEVNAGRAFEQLKKMIETRHTVLREGVAIQLETRAIVPGDILLLDAGDIIAADCRIIESNELHVNESTLTGESYPVEKQAGNISADSPLNKKYNCLWQGTNVISGTAKVIVINTGAHTVFGQMAHSLTQTPETTFEKGIKRFGYFLLRITLVLALVILAANLYADKPLFDSILFSLALAVGMAPELLPAIMTFAMSAGARRMMKKKVIVKKLSTIFNFGEVNVLCTDKTGTITEGRVNVKDIIDVNGNTSEQLRLYACLNASFQNGFVNPIDEALVSTNVSLSGYKKINEVPYDFIRKRLSVAVENGRQRFFITKGAFTNLLDICSYVQTASGIAETMTESVRKDAERRFALYSEEGYRVLGIASKTLTGDKMSRADEQEMIFLGYILLEDPLKSSAQSSVARLKELHIDIKIITGDNRYAAFHAAKAIGLAQCELITGEEIDKLYPEGLVIKAKQMNVFAEIEPHQKEQIIKALQKSHFTVAYIGDGINDVAAINAADIGISTSNAVAVAREAADFVLLEKELSVLADGVYEGRRSFANSMKYVFITTGATFGNMFSVAASSLFLPFLPMLPKQILLTNLLTDIPFLTIASDHADNDQLIRPGKWNLKMIRNFMIIFGLHSSLFDFLTFYVLYIHYRLSGSLFQTAWFLESAITELLIVFVIRTRKSFLKSRPGKTLLSASLAAFVIIVLLPISPFAYMLGFSALHIPTVLAIMAIIILYFITADIIKLVFFRINEKTK